MIVRRLLVDCSRLAMLAALVATVAWTAHLAIQIGLAGFGIHLAQGMNVSKIPVALRTLFTLFIFIGGLLIVAVAALPGHTMQRRRLPNTDPISVLVKRCCEMIGVDPRRLSVELNAGCYIQIRRVLFSRKDVLTIGTGTLGVITFENLKALIVHELAHVKFKHTARYWSRTVLNEFAGSIPTSTTALTAVLPFPFARQYLRPLAIPALALLAPALLLVKFVAFISQHGFDRQKESFDWEDTADDLAAQTVGGRTFAEAIYRIELLRARYRENPLLCEAEHIANAAWRHPLEFNEATTPTGPQVSLTHRGLTERFRRLGVEDAVFVGIGFEESVLNDMESELPFGDGLTLRRLSRQSHALYGTTPAQIRQYAPLPIVLLLAWCIHEAIDLRAFVSGGGFIPPLIPSIMLALGIGICLAVLGPLLGLLLVVRRQVFALFLEPFEELSIQAANLWGTDRVNFDVSRVPFEKPEERVELNEPFPASDPLEIDPGSGRRITERDQRVIDYLVRLWWMDAAENMPAGVLRTGGTVPEARPTSSPAATMRASDFGPPPLPQEGESVRSSPENRGADVEMCPHCKTAVLFTSNGCPQCGHVSQPSERSKLVGTPRRESKPAEPTALFEWKSPLVEPIRFLFGFVSWIITALGVLFMISLGQSPVPMASFIMGAIMFGIGMLARGGYRTVDHGFRRSMGALMAFLAVACLVGGMIVLTGNDREAGLLIALAAGGTSIFVLFCAAIVLGPPPSESTVISAEAAEPEQTHHACAASPRSEQRE